MVLYVGLAATLALYAVSFGRKLFEFSSKIMVLDDTESILKMLGMIDAGSLKVKVAATIVLISSIHLLQVFRNSAEYIDSKLMWLTIMHMAFVVSALFSAYVDKVMAQTKKDKDGDH